MIISRLTERRRLNRPDAVVDARFLSIILMQKSMDALVVFRPIRNVPVLVIDHHADAGCERERRQGAPSS